MEKSLSALSGYKPVEKSFKRDPLPEGPMKLSEEEAHSALLSTSRKSGEVAFQRFHEAREMLASLYDGEISLVRRPHEGIRLAARLEFLTTHRTIDENLDQMVRAAGFSLALSIRPPIGLSASERYEQIPGRFIEEELQLASSGVLLRRTPVYEQRMERRYIITENPHVSGGLRRAAESAESLLRLAGRLRPANLPEDMRLADVVPIDSARCSRAPPPGPSNPSLSGAKAS